MGATAQLGPLTPVPHTLVLTVADNVGNVGTGNFTVVTTDTTPPTITVAPSGGFTTPNPFFNVSYNDPPPASGIDNSSIRATLDGQTHQAAEDAAHEMFQSRNADKARAVAARDAQDDHAKLETFDIDGQGTVRVTLSKQAKSYVLHNFQPTRDWYNVRVSASAVPK